MPAAVRPRRWAPLLVAVIALAPRSTAQYAADGAVALALAGAITARGDGRQFAWNPATSPRHGRIVSAGGHTVLGGLAGMGDAVLSATIPVDSTVVAAGSLGGVGYGSYRFVVVGASAAAAIGRDFTAGAGLRLEAQSIIGYGTSVALLLDAGACGRLLGDLWMGVAARNVTGAGLRGIPRPQQIALGISLSAADSVDLAVDLQHEAGRGAVAVCGVSLRCGNGLVGRAGLRLDGSLAGAGATLDDGQLFVDLAMAWTQAIGAQLAAGVGMRW